MALAISDATAASLYGPPEVTESEDLLRHRRRESEGMTLKLQAGLETRRKRRPVEKKGDCGAGLSSRLELCRNAELGADDDDDDAHHGESRPEEMTAKRRAEHQCPADKQL
ncbi:hypothetical protein F2Q70_00011569 [Brassica cretica]|uniref:Uncharacterized protein n=1 Tax=Brassica cretica TaxID=69181 RepID=A0A3N6R8L0_BRACR|nr:hypothetical protein F2Q70_00011569 [Brassica cretica]KAF3543682.1 hypothetical protein DY000_02006946 [Brassica cretica]